MSRQNRVTPFGDLIATSERGTYMGNRGVLHEEGRIRRAWQVKRWLVCVLERRGRKRSVFQIDPGTGERLGATVGDGGRVELSAPITVRAGEAFVAAPEQAS